MPALLKLSKADARRALVRHHFAPCGTQMDAFERLRSIQFDPIAPCGCNHDLVLQARVPGYKIGDWEKTAYEDRLVYDGWDKQASLVPYEGWPLRRVTFDWACESPRIRRMQEDHPEAVASILRDLEERGPMLPKELDFQLHREDLKGTWWGPSVTKNVLRGLWHTGRVMTSGRKRGQHLYDLTERVVPPLYLNAPRLSEQDSIEEIILDRHRAMGILQLTPQTEVWGMNRIYYAPVRKPAIASLAARGDIVPVEVEGMKGHATPAFLPLLDQPSPEPRVVFVAPLDQFMWDRKMVRHVFGFDYIWEIYTPEPKRRWGYYVLPVLFGDDLVARVEFWARKGVLEIRRWHWEGDVRPGFMSALEDALSQFMRYCSASKAVADSSVDRAVRDLARKFKP